MGIKKKKNQDEESFSQQDIQRHLELLRDILENTQANIKKTLGLLRERNIDADILLNTLQEAQEASAGFVADHNGNERIIEGVFNGEKMIGGDGLEYNMPANYASKSKLVEGDILKLTIAKDGSFIYKQIGPLERIQLVATLARDEVTGDWYAIDGKKRWKLLTASVTYFHGNPGDDVVILIPKDGDSKWAAVENVIKK
ncbi:MAG: hypothetical protein RB292_02920 [Patescibacteria group bacterium]|jgi:hypothetical protein|nr:hypothetical protein [Patescibacteria group bacterium]